MTNTATTARYRVLGTTEDFDTCECCGRTGLKKVVALQTAEGDITYFGTSCAAQAAGWTTKEVNQKVTAAKKEVADAALNAYREWVRQETGYGSMVLALKAMHAAGTWISFDDWKAANTDTFGRVAA